MAAVTVIIPCYNAEHYIEKCLCALKKQTYQDFNVILVDDCSTDQTASVISEYPSDLNILYHRNDTNSGPAKSRNTGIALAETEYVCFCDADDWYDDDFLAAMMEASVPSSADMILCGYKTVTAGGKVSIKHTLSLPHGEVSKTDVLTQNVDSLCTLMIRKSIAAEYPIPDLRNGEDMAIIPIWELHASRFAIVTEAMYNYMLRSGSSSNRPSGKVVASLIHSFEFITAGSKGEYPQEIEYIGIRNVLYGAVLNQYKASRKKSDVRSIVAEFETQFPEWKSNPYLGQLPFFKRLFLKNIGRRRYAMVHCLTLIHKLLTVVS